MTPLEAEIRAMIALDGPMPLSRYMALCLSHPIHGYYVTRDPLGETGDFTTAPEISQIFGELIGLWAAAVWQRMGQPSQINLVELGPGRGTLMADALRAARVLPAFRSAISVHLVETSPVLRVRQQAVLEGADAPIAWHRDVAQLPDGPMIVIANEFFDALPIDQAVKGERGWHERMIGLGENGRLQFMAHPMAIPNVGDIMPSALNGAPRGAVFEWRADHVTRDLAKRVGAQGGAALIIDYGHITSDVGDTFQAVRAHQFCDPLDAPGEADLTAHVDFAALGRVASAAGAAVHGPLIQGAFLRRLGIEVRAAKLKEAATEAQAADIDSAVARLTEGGQGMGEMFKVLAIADPKLGALPGFEG